MAQHIGLAALLIVLVSPVMAQTPVSLDDALASARANNPALAAARARADAADAGAAVARGPWFPRVTLTESVTRSDQPVFAFGAMLSARQFTAADFAVARLNSPGATSLFTTRVGVQQLIFDGGRTSAAVSESSARRDGARAAADEADTHIALDVTRTYGQLLTLQATSRALDGAVAAASEDLRRAERRRDAGTVTDADVLAVAVHLSDLRQRQIQLSADAAGAAARLNRLMGAPVEVPVVLMSPQDVVAALPESWTVASDGLAALFAEAETSRPDLRCADADVRAAAAGSRQASSTWWPQVAAQAGVEWNGLTVGDRARAWIIGGEARWSLSISGADRARVKAAASARSAAELQRDDLRSAVRVDVLSAVRQLEAAVARISVGAESVEQAAERARVVRNRYDAGLASMTDVLTASSALLDAEARHIAAQVDALNANANTQRALGRQIGK